MVIKVQPHHLQAIQGDAESRYPSECCGLLLGKMSGDVKTIREVLPTENSWDDSVAETFSEITGSGKLGTTRRERYSIAPDTLLKVQKQVRDRDLDIIGVYHSHPDHPAVPSEFDRALAWEEYSYIIVSVLQGEAADLRSWCLDGDLQFQPEKILKIESS
ncbi:MAG: M67 family metallopeptidase [Hormoscilla sp. GM102CHS1]|nr:M67 family metallopeptidase [Hormoscilla sp. GM102CHS1]